MCERVSVCIYICERVCVYVCMDVCTRQQAILNLCKVLLFIYIFFIRHHSY